MSAKLTSRQVGEVTVVDIEGRITLGEGSSLLRDELRHLISTNRRKILINLADVTYMDSAAVGQLVAGFTTVTNQGGQLKLLKLNKHVKKILEMTKISGIFEAYDDESAAVMTFA